MQASSKRIQAALRAHNKRVAAVVAQLGQPSGKGKLVKLYHGSSNSTRMQQYTGRHVVDTSALNHVIEVNVRDKYVLVEPSVHMDQLVDATLAYGMVPPVVMEFPAITVGGGIEGGAGESSSFKYGGFHETALEYEIILGDGTVQHVSRTRKPDLFWGTAGSYGSLGIITLVKLRLVPAQPYVKLTYHRTASYKDALAHIESVMRKPAGTDFIDGVLYSPSLGTIMTGAWAKVADGPVATFSRPGDDWFYLHAQKMVQKHQAHTEYIPTKEYLFRYDRGAFWMGRVGIEHLKLPFIKPIRRLFDHHLHTSVMYPFLHASKLSQKLFVQDMFMPKENMEGFIQYIVKKLNIWPLWLLPIRSNRQRMELFGLGHVEEGPDYLINVGVWGKAPTHTFAEFKALNREVEAQLVKSRAHKILYAHSYYPREEFWKIYNRARYQDLRKKYRAQGIFQDVYDKVTVTHEYTVPLKKAILRYLVDKLLGRNTFGRPV